MEKPKKILINSPVIDVVINAPANFKPDCLVIHFTPTGARPYHLEMSGKGDVFEVVAMGPTEHSDAGFDKDLLETLSGLKPGLLGG